MEAARVLEDLARFVVEEGALAAGFKGIRHEVSLRVEEISGGDRAIHRDVAGDPGTSIDGLREGRRSTLAEVARANASRLTEALRALEEAAKLGAIGQPSPAAAIESLRYRAYDLSARLVGRLQAAEPRQWKVCLLLTHQMCRLPWRQVLESSLGAGLDAVQVREKDLSTRDLVAHVKEVMSIASSSGASVIVNDRADVAVAAGAHGVHLGRDDLAIGEARRIAGRSMLIGATVHDEAEARAAVEAGADYCGVGPMFATLLKPNLRPAGPSWMAEFVKRWPQLPHLAIGGITPASMASLVAVGCQGVAVSSCVCGADDPGALVAEIRASLP